MEDLTSESFTLVVLAKDANSFVTCEARTQS